MAVEKQFGDWTNDGTCEGTGEDKTCGAGLQKQTRTCTDGTTDPCTDAEKARTIACALPACPEDKTCGPGVQKQTRTCEDGTKVDETTDYLCTDAEKEQSISCADAGTALPACVDPCAEVTCALTGEACSGGVCRCGTAATCEGSTTTDSCDADNNMCKCGAAAACTGGKACTAGACTGGEEEGAAMRMVKAARNLFK